MWSPQSTAFGGMRIPPELFDVPRWYACYTRARHEKKVAEMLSQRQMESYLPTVERLSQWKDRKKMVQFPLFPGYVFGRFTLRDLHAVLGLPGISTVIRTNGYPTPIPDEDLENVRRFAVALAQVGLQPEPRPFFAEGQRVRVREGPFAGVQGMVVEARNARRVIVGLEAIGQGLEIDIDAALLEAVK